MLRAGMAGAVAVGVDEPAGEPAAAPGETGIETELGGVAVGEPAAVGGDDSPDVPAVS